MASARLVGETFPYVFIVRADATKASGVPPSPRDDAPFVGKNGGESGERHF
jgi:hypothetical protein